VGFLAHCVGAANRLELTQGTHSKQGAEEGQAITAAKAGGQLVIQDQSPGTSRRQSVLEQPIPAYNKGVKTFALDFIRATLLGMTRSFIMTARKIAIKATALALSLTAAVVWAAQSAHPSSTDLLQFLPDGSGVVIVDFDKVTTSSVWSSSANQKGLKDTLEKVQPGITELVNFSDIRTMAVATQGFDLNNIAGVATGNFNQSEILSRLRANTKIKLSSEQYKGLELQLITIQDGSGSRKDAAFALYDATTLIAGTARGVRAVVDTKLSGKNSMAQNAKLTAALAEVQPAAIRFALTSTSAITSSELPIQNFSSISLIFGTIDLTSSVDFSATLRSDSGEHAKSIAESLNGLLSMARGYLGAGDPKLAPFAELLKTVTITNAEADIKVTGNLSMDLLNTLLGVNRKR